MTALAPPLVMPRTVRWCSYVGPSGRSLFIAARRPMFPATLPNARVSLMFRTRTSVTASVLAAASLVGCGSEAVAPAVSPSETRAERVDMADILDEICGLYAEGEGQQAREAMNDAVSDDEGRSRADVERIVYAECGDAVVATSLEEIASGEQPSTTAKQQISDERDESEFAERVRGACTSDDGSEVVCTEGMAVTFDEETCDLGEDPFYWSGSLLNMNAEPVDATIIIEVVDDAGVRVGEGSAVVRHLQPGRESTFRTMGNHRVTDQGTCQLVDVRVDRH